jgi:hypothetical protein
MILKIIFHCHFCCSGAVMALLVNQTNPTASHRELAERRPQTCRESPSRLLIEFDQGLAEPHKIERRH